MSNTVWDKAEMVDFYANQWQLYEPEKVIREMLAKDLPVTRMLDIGVGAGRTTHHFVREVEYYAGIDISEPMLEKCRQKFGTSGDHVTLRLMDATNLHEFRDNEFNFVLFSYNGIDCVSHADRIKILSEIKRVLAPGGIFAFSSHNIHFIPKLYSLNLSSNPLTSFKRLAKWAVLVLLNGWHSNYRSKDYALLRAGDYGFKLALYYIDPEYQVKQLQQLGFENTRMFSYTGRELTKTTASQSEPWIYYLCNNEK